ncbi:hypothetical protein, partial [Cupriavidus basilensis]|uniref:hypothetical protein n=1 Tax=Cupriavidus basilensis TaxID=68895 RepID=UPI0023E7F727
MLKRLGVLATAVVLAACGGHSATDPTSPTRGGNAEPAAIQPVSPPSMPTQSVPASKTDTATQARETAAG